MRNSTKGLSSDQRGALALLFGLLLIPLIGFMGLAVDTSRYYAVKQQLQQSLDSAVLAGGRSISSPDRNLIIQRYFDNNWKTGRYGAVPSALTITGSAVTGHVTVAATADVPLLLMPILLGYNTAIVDSRAEITREDSTLEAALVLDVSGSMLDRTGVPKITDLRNASKLLVDILYPSGLPSPYVYLSVVPWDHEVKVGMGYNSWLDPASLPITASTFTSPVTPVGPPFGLYQTAFSNPACPINGSSGGYNTVYFDSIQESAKYVGEFELRQPPFDLTDDPPSVHDFKPTLCWQADLWRAGALVCHDYFLQCDGPPSAHAVLPLRNDPTLIKTYINGLHPTGATNSMTGLFWGWMSISPNWQGLWSGVPATMPKAYATPYNYKAVILMTDGLNNLVAPAYNPIPVGTFPDNSTPPHIIANADYINNRSVLLCAALKAQGVKVYTVGFDLNSLLPPDRTRVETYLKGCASSTANYFPAPTGASLVSVFSAIASDLASLRISH